MSLSRAWDSLRQYGNQNLVSLKARHNLFDAIQDHLRSTTRQQLLDVLCSCHPVSSSSSSSSPLSSTSYLLPDLCFLVFDYLFASDVRAPFREILSSFAEIVRSEQEHREQQAKKEPPSSMSKAVRRVATPTRSKLFDL
jgi:hypothetical protein